MEESPTLVVQLIKLDNILFNIDNETTYSSQEVELCTSSLIHDMEKTKVKTEPHVSLVTVKKEKREKEAETNKYKTEIEHLSKEMVINSTLHQSVKQEPHYLLEDNVPNNQKELLNIIEDETKTAIKEEGLYMKIKNEELNGMLVQELKHEDMKHNVDITEHKIEFNVNNDKQLFTNIHEEDIKPAMNKDEVGSVCMSDKQISDISATFIQKRNILNTNNMNENTCKEIDSVHNYQSKHKFLSIASLNDMPNSRKTIKKQSHGKAYSCNNCDKIYKRKYELLRHLHLLHKNRSDSMNTETCFICPVCDRNFSQKGNLKKHLNLIHKDITHVKCKKCNKVISCLEYLKVHLKLSYPNKIPPKNSTSKENLMKDYKVIDYVCDECGEKFLQSKHIIYHMKFMHNGIKRSICGKCGKGFSHVETLTKHIKKVHRELGKCECEICGKIYFHKRSLKSHIDSSHSVRKYECEICFKIYFHKDSLRYHINSAHANNSNIRQRAITCVCDVCGKTFSRLQELGMHFSLMHNHDKVVYMCDLCGQAFTKKANLNNHIVTIHDQIISFYCAECGKGFSLKGTLKNHINICHRSIKNYACVVCRKKFNTSEGLKHHVSSTHTGIRNFKCSECGEQFYTEYSLKCHFNSKHHIKNEKCNMCNKKFAKVSSLRRHQHIMHKDNKHKFSH